ESRYRAEDALDLVRGEYEPLPPVIAPEPALELAAPVLHDAIGTNLACHRHLVYGDPGRAFAEADVVIRERFRFPKFSSTPIETYGVVASFEPTTGILTVWSNFMGPFIMHPLVARSLGLPENRLRFNVPPHRELGGPVSVPGPRGGRLGGDDQQVPHRPEPRLRVRPPLLRDRAHDGSPRRAARPRPGRGAPAQLHPGRPVPLPHPDRRPLRLRRLPGRLREGPPGGSLRGAPAGAGARAVRGAALRHRPRGRGGPLRLQHGIRHHRAR